MVNFPGFFNSNQVVEKWSRHIVQQDTSPLRAHRLLSAGSELRSERGEGAERKGERLFSHTH